MSKFSMRSFNSFFGGGGGPLTEVKKSHTFPSPLVTHLVSIWGFGAFWPHISPSSFFTQPVLCTTDSSLRRLIIEVNFRGNLHGCHRNYTYCFDIMPCKGPGPGPGRYRERDCTIGNSRPWSMSQTSVNISAWYVRTHQILEPIDPVPGPCPILSPVLVQCE